MKTLVLHLIRGYQKYLSLDQGYLGRIASKVSGTTIGTCRFYPTCSEYTYQAIDTYGILNGAYLGFKRIIRCQPFSKGGFDPLP